MPQFPQNLVPVVGSPQFGQNFGAVGENCATGDSVEAFSALTFAVPPVPEYEFRLVVPKP